MMQETETKAKVKRDRAKQAIALAMESRWEEAASVNRESLELFPNDVEALNRLGKALAEMGRYSEAKQTFQRAVEVCPSNCIAKRNLERLSLLRESRPHAPSKLRASSQKVPPHFFIEETGKTGVTSLVERAPKEVLARTTAGEPVYLEAREHRLLAKNGVGEQLGTIEPKLGLRLLRLMRGGNRYEAAAASLNDQEIKVIIRETYQHPSQAGKLSFPPRGPDDFRPYMWEGAFRYGAEEDEEAIEEHADEWGEERGSGYDELTPSRRASGRSRRASSTEEEEEQ